MTLSTPFKQKQKYKKLTPKVKEEIKELAKQKFIRLKLQETGIVILSILTLIYLPYLLGLLFTETIGFWNIWSKGFAIIIGIAFVLAVLTLFGSLIWIMIREFLRNNWSKAYRRAENEVGVKSNYSGWTNDWYKDFYKKNKNDK